MKRTSKWEVVFVAVICTLAGLFVGRRIAPAAAQAQGDEEEHAHGAPALSSTTRANLGIEVGELTPGSFVRTIPVAAEVVATPRTIRPVFAPIGGRITSIDVRRGTIVEPGSAVVTLVRDPLPRPTLTFTADILRPAQEMLHDQVLELRKSAEEVEISRTELERIESFTGDVGGDDLPLIPRERAIDMRYQLLRAEKANELARHELLKHGLTEAQIESVEAGSPLPEVHAGMWQRALARNGLWPATAQGLADVLPEDLMDLPWVTATIGELAAAGLVTSELVTWIAGADVGASFLDIGVLLQRGHTVTDLARLHASNALDPIVRVEAPDLAGGVWDVAGVLVQAGAHVDAGDALVDLRDPRELWLHAEPVGGEVAGLLAAAQSGGTFRARPLLTDAGPLLEDLEIRSMTSDPDHGGTTASFGLTNRIRSAIDIQDGASRAWDLREGQRYVLEVPVERWDDVYVLPANAVAKDGPDQVVFLEDGDTFRPVPVVVRHQDARVVVLPASGPGELFPGDRIATRGAFEIGLALSGGDAVGGHHGHSH